ASWSGDAGRLDVACAPGDTRRALGRATDPGRCDMARDGYLILDSDLHMMEPDDLWARYLEEPHRASPPRFFGGQQQTLSDSSEDKGHADTIMGMEVQGL